MPLHDPIPFSLFPANKLINILINLYLNFVNP